MAGSFRLQPSSWYRKALLIREQPSLSAAVAGRSCPVAPLTLMGVEIGNVSRASPDGNCGNNMFTLEPAYHLERPLETNRRGTRGNRRGLPPLAGGVPWDVLCFIVFGRSSVVSHASPAVSPEGTWIARICLACA